MEPFDTVGLSSMAFDELMELKRRLDGVLKNRIEVEKEALKAELKALEHLETRALSDIPLAPIAGSRQRAKSAPKFRHPETGEIWSGRGKQPRWFREAIKAGHTRAGLCIDP